MFALTAIAGGLCLGGLVTLVYVPRFRRSDLVFLACVMVVVIGLIIALANGDWLLLVGLGSLCAWQVIRTVRTISQSGE